MLVSLPGIHGLLKASDARRCRIGALLLGAGLGALGLNADQIAPPFPVESETMQAGRFEAVESWQPSGRWFRTVVVDEGGNRLLLLHDEPWPLGHSGVAAISGRPLREALYPGAFDEAGFLRSRGISGKFRVHGLGGLEPASGLSAMLRRWTSSARLQVLRKFHRWGDSSGVVFLRAVMIGDRRGMPKSTKGAFANAGLAHLTAVSGFHTGLVAAALFFLLSVMRIPRAWKAALLWLGIWGYVGVCGSPSSAVRAAVMASMLSLADAWRLRADGLTLLSTAGLVMFAFKPHAMTDLGVQLSFSATLGILLLHRRLRSMDMRGGRALRRGLMMCGVPLVAVACTAPFAWPVFGKVPWIFLPANVVITPLVTCCTMVAAAGLAIPAPFDLWWSPVCVRMAEALLCLVSLLGGCRPLILPLDGQVVMWSGVLMAGGCIVGLLVKHTLRWMLAGFLGAFALLRWQSDLERQGLVFPVAGDLIVLEGGQWTVFTDSALGGDDVLKWETRTMLERVSHQPVPSAQWCGQGLAFSRALLRFKRPDGTWGEISSSPSRCGSRAPHTLPRPPCP